MSRTIEIECTADVYIDDYVNEISDEALFEEALHRLRFGSQKSQSKTEFKTHLAYDMGTNIAELIASTHNLNIIQASKLEEFLKELL